MNDSILHCVSNFYYMIVALFLFFIGLCGVTFSKNLLKIFISIEFIINGINILFISFASYKSVSDYLGYTIVLYISVISAITLSVGLYFTHIIYKKFNTINVLEIYKKYKGMY